MKLALNGGPRITEDSIPSRTTMGDEEVAAAEEVIRSGVLSAFIGGPTEQFNGGKYIRAFEEQWAEKFGYKHAITVNSWTTGLVTCLGAVGISPGDEVIVPAYTMSASATSILFYGGIPVFADIDPRSFCLSPDSIEQNITEYTKAIMVVHLFGGCADMDQIIKIADKYNLRVIEDGAQAPLASFNGIPVGAMKDIGGFSLNYHKHIHTGEGGVIVTNDDELAQRSRLIRNHGENCVESYEVSNLSNVIGSNYRLTEIQAAIGIAQLRKLPSILRARRELAAYFAKRITTIPGITFFPPPEHITHSYYITPLLINESELGISRARFIQAVNAEFPAARDYEDVPLVGGYVRPLYLSPIYQQRKALGNSHFPFSLAKREISYAPGICPVTERMYRSELMYTPLIREPLTEEHIDLLIAAMAKVVENYSEIA